METGTLKELNVKPGDVVEFVEWEDGPSKSGRFAYGKVYTIKESGLGLIADSGCGYFTEDGWGNTFRIISRAAQTPPDLTAITTPFGLLDEATQEALRAHGGPYEMWDGEEWDEGIPFWYGDCTYRVQPKPKSETITCDAYIHPSGIISKIESDNPQPVRVTFNRINGVIDLASYKVEPR